MNAIASAVSTAVRSWSVNQEQIFDWIQHGAGNLVIIAVAGSGKTTTIAEAFRRVAGSSIFLAFGRANVKDLKSRGVNARTFHSLCFQPVMSFTGARDVNPNKLRELIDANILERDARLYGAFAVRMVGLARNAGLGALVDDTEQAWVALAEHHDVQLEQESANFATGIKVARDLLQWSNASNEVDYDDMLYIAVREGLVLPKFDWIFVDEAQDTNAIQRAILRKIMNVMDASNPFVSSIPSRLVAVGDPRQAIFGFRGSDAQSIELIKQDFNAIELPLTVSYRCPKAVVEYARNWVDHIEAAPGAIEGAVNELGQKWDCRNFVAGDLVICRLTRPVITLAYRLLRARVPAYVFGRDIGEGLQALINKMNAKGVDALVERLQTYTAREIEKARAKKQDHKIEGIQDKTDCILYLIETLEETSRSVPELLRTIDGLFSDKALAGAVKLSTVHRAKGLEADRVFWLNPDAQARARKDWQLAQEDNLCYVAVTRAKQELNLIHEPKRDRK